MTLPMIITRIIVCVVVIVLCLYYLFPIVKVCGDSMSPTYNDGEFLLCSRFFKVNVGDVVVFKTPYDDKRIVIKRVSEITVPDRQFMYCLGDNLERSYDSRKYGYVGIKRRVICKPFDQRRKAGEYNE